MKRTTILLLLSLFMCSVKAQLLTGNLTSAGREMTSKAVEKSMFLARVSYKITNRETGKSFGRNGKPEFNSVMTVAVRTEDGMMLSSEALKPWNVDSDFEKYATEFNGVLTSVAVCSVCDSIFMPASVPVSSNSEYEIIDAQTMGGLSINSELGDRNGWVVWVVSSAEASADDTNVKIEAQKVNINISDTTSFSPITIVPKYAKILGGIYVEPFYVGSGIVKYKLTGFVENRLGKWVVTTPFKMPKHTTHTSVEKASDVEALTEIGGGNDDNKANNKKTKKKK